MLRAAVVVIGGTMLAGAAFGLLTCWQLSAVLPLAIGGVIVAGGVLFERWRYRSLMGDRPGQDWHSTQERFVDPESGRLVTVFFNPATGERRYVAGDRHRLAVRG